MSDGWGRILLPGLSTWYSGWHMYNENADLYFYAHANYVFFPSFVNVLGIILCHSGGNDETGGKGRGHPDGTLDGIMWLQPHAGRSRVLIVRIANLG